MIDNYWDAKSWDILTREGWNDGDPFEGAGF